MDHISLQRLHPIGPTLPLYPEIHPTLPRPNFEFIQKPRCNILLEKLFEGENDGKLKIIEKLKKSIEGLR